METRFDKNIDIKYHSKSQIARIMTENWVAQNLYCPRCGNPRINRFENNRPVADFYCPNCRNEYELKSKNGSISRKVNDGAYDTMIKRITGNENPDFLFMNYSKLEFEVVDLFFVPKHFFLPKIIEKRKALAPTAVRAGWVGCNILIDKILKQGVIPIIQNGIALPKEDVCKRVEKSSLLKKDNLSSRGWLFDVLDCVNGFPSTFSLEEIYSFEEILAELHPGNNNIKPKIRQQLQFLRDKGFIEFLGNGKYRRVE